MGPDLASMNEKDYYEILGVSKDSTTEEIRRAFQKKARTLHPDVNKEPDAEDRFKEVSEAYAVLSDPDKRRRYDAMRSGSPFAGGYSGSPSPGGYQGADPFGWGGFPFGGAPAGGAGGYGRETSKSRSYNPKVGSDVVYELVLDDDAAKNGCKRGVTYQRYVRCDVCGGEGSVESTTPETCPTCGGTGHISLDLQDILGFGVMNVVCPECEGTGKVVSDPCSACGGTGRTLSADEVVVEVPANSHDGEQVRVSGKGNAGSNGQKAGDFVARIVLPKERLSRQSAQGFQLVGLSLPFILVGLVANMLAQMSMVICIPLVVGLFMVLSQGIGGRSGRWWANGLRALLNGLVNGAVFALLIFAFISCSSSMGMRGYLR